MVLPSAKSMGSSEPLDSPAFDAEAITPSDTEEIKNTRAVYVGITGDLAVVMVSGRSVIFTNVPVGSIMPIAVKQILATGTNCDDIVALF